MKTVIIVSLFGGMALVLHHTGHFTSPWLLLLAEIALIFPLVAFVDDTSLIAPDSRRTPLILAVGMIVTVSLLLPITYITRSLILPDPNAPIELPRLIAFLVAHLTLASAIWIAVKATPTKEADKEFKRCSPLLKCVIWVFGALMTLAYFAIVLDTLFFPLILLADWIRGTQEELNSPRVVEVTTLVFDVYMLLALTLFLLLLGWATSQIALSIRMDEKLTIRHGSRTRAQLLGLLDAVRACAFGLAILLFVVLTTSVLVRIGIKPAIQLHLAMERLPLEWIELGIRIILLASCAGFAVVTTRLQVGPTPVDHVMAEYRLATHRHPSTAQGRKAVAEQLKNVDCSKCPEAFQAAFFKFISEMSRGEGVILSSTWENLAREHFEKMLSDVAANVP